ncbi:MAG: presenilin family intramembrane aspartyl protease [Nanoarchaeota archaeon]
MKHSIKVTAILLVLFLIAQLVGIFVLNLYKPEIIPIQLDNETIINITSHGLPYGLEPPQETSKTKNLWSIVFAFIIAIIAIIFLMRFKAELLLRIWFFIVVIIAIAVSLFAPFKTFPYASLIVLGVALILAYFKVFRRNIIVHNLTELLIYPGIAAIFVPLLNVGTAVLLFIIFSAYDMYAVWHAKFMQKMAHYQINKVKVFSGFFVPYLSKKDKLLLKEAEKSGKKKEVKVSVAILGGGDIVFPIILAGTVLNSLGLFASLLVSIGATIALAFLLYKSEKGKFYPALPFISVGCFVALAIAYLI